MKSEVVENERCCGCSKKKSRVVLFEGKHICRQCLAYLLNRINGEAERFDEFWRVYPKKTNKKGASDIWRKHGLDEVADKIVSDVRKKSLDWKAGEAKFIPMPTTYLNQRRWEDGVGTNAIEVTWR